MHVSNFRPVKRVVDVIEVFAGIRREMPAKLVMAGDGPDRPRAAARARQLGVDRDVIFLGKHGAIEELLSCADLFLMTSDRESFGLAALEALSCGVPVVGYGAGGLPEVVPDGEAGVLVGVGEVEEATAAAARLLGDPARWKRFSGAAREVAVERFGRCEVLPRYEAYYEDVLAGAGR